MPQCERTALANLGASAGSEVMKYRVWLEVFPLISRSEVTRPIARNPAQSGWRSTSHSIWSQIQYSRVSMRPGLYAPLVAVNRLKVLTVFAANILKPQPDIAVN